MEKDLTRKYSNGEITIVWKPDSCMHSTICWKQNTGLPSVFDPHKKPWINPNGAKTDKIIEQVKKCPSGALSFYYNDQPKNQPQVNLETQIETIANGPLVVYGNISIKDRNGNLIKRNNVTSFCRCGKSQNKPFCDGSHLKHNFEG
jgi:uncharacterized Fe-S cluster protein YjdI